MPLTFGAANHDQRLAVIAEWLSPHDERGFLARYKPPPGLSHHALKAELVELGTLINERCPSGLTQEQLRDFLLRAGAIINRRARSRSWPLLRDWDEAFDALREERAAASTERDHELENGVKWAATGNGPIANYDQERIVRAAIERGVATAEHLDRKGWTVPADIRANLPRRRTEPLAADRVSSLAGNLRVDDFGGDDG